MVQFHACDEGAEIRLLNMCRTDIAFALDAELQETGEEHLAECHLYGFIFVVRDTEGEAALDLHACAGLALVESL